MTEYLPKWLPVHFIESGSQKLNVFFRTLRHCHASPGILRKLNNTRPVHIFAAFSFVIRHPFSHFSVTVYLKYEEKRLQQHSELFAKFPMNVVWF